MKPANGIATTPFALVLIILILIEESMAILLSLESLHLYKNARRPDTSVEITVCFNTLHATCARAGDYIVLIESMLPSALASSLHG